MNARWAVRLPPNGVASATGLRLEPGIEVLEHDDGLWLRGPDCDERLEARLRTLPGAVRYDVLPDGQLLPMGKRLPRGRRIYVFSPQRWTPETYRMVRTRFAPWSPDRSFD